MKKIFGVILKPLEFFFKSMDKIAAHLSIVSKRPELPALTNYGPLIEKKEDMNFFN